MDAVQFIYEARRRYKVTGQVCSVLSVGVAPENIVKELELWCKEHPRKTRQSVFLEQHPNAKLNNKGIVDIWPCCVEKNMMNDRDCINTFCVKCREEFWSQEVE